MPVPPPARTANRPVGRLLRLEPFVASCLGVDAAERTARTCPVSLGQAPVRCCSVGINTKPRRLPCFQGHWAESATTLGLPSSGFADGRPDSPGWGCCWHSGPAEVERLFRLG